MFHVISEPLRIPRRWASLSPMLLWSDPTMGTGLRRCGRKVMRIPRIVSQIPDNGTIPTQVGTQDGR
jgi:hypothetical protein